MTAELIHPLPEAPAPVELPAPQAGRSTVDRLLDSIDDLVRRHRALAAHDGASAALHAELIAAELDQQVAILRTMPRQPGS
ncbi:MULTISPECIES: hypothetical protein [Pseudonocardia]|uniref:Uncharacterized protein n=1 Tax=Pseudonocardia alni subsp. carboxydivorans TaxID=415010 RepID=A0ABU9ANJ5_PSEA5|nr:MULTISPECIES: hypothetical protein [Pseudonocardia]MCM3847239.1 hypothetical protein [Pseudonocardia sp. DR1-2]NWJ72809.1 hypothetical protein [Pseudonocardia pini]WFG42451.1 hypothetical protein PaSha_02115 [Pseudonocardia alni]